MHRRSPGIDFRAAIAAAVLCTVLAGCSEHYRSAVWDPDSLYAERRETISPLAGDSLYANSIAQAVDPWSRASANRNIAFNGERMQAASERYRTGRVIPPVSAMTSTSYSQQAKQGATGASSGSATSVK
jgi:hypothetical protein